MKVSRILSVLALSAISFVACQKPVDLGPEKLVLESESSLEIPVEGGEFNLTLTATLDWGIQGYDEDVQSWLTINPSSGKASADPQKINFRILPNDDVDRTASLVFYGNVLCKAPLTITQKGAKGDGQNITVAEFLQKKDTQKEYVLTGVIGDIANSSSYYGFSLKDETGSVSCPFPVNFSDFSFHTGDKVSIKGKYEFYDKKQQDQLADGQILTHEPASVENIQTKTVAEFIKAADPFSMYRLSGTVSSDVNTQYCSFDLKDETGTIVVWTVNNAAEWKDKVQKGGTVTLRGAYTLYTNAETGAQKHEVVDAYIESFTPGTGGGDGGGEDDGGSVQKPVSATKISVKEFISKPVNMTDWYELTGTVASIASTSYGNFYIEDESGKVYIYGLTKAWAEGKNDQSFSQIGLAVGDKVTIWTLRAEYNGSAQGGGKDCPALYISHEKGEAPKYPEGSVVLTFPDENKENNKVNGYDQPWVAKSGTNEFTMTAFNNYEWNNWTYIRCGRKASASVASVVSKTAIAAKVAKVVFTLDSVTASDVNAITTIVYSDAERTKKVCEIKHDGTLAAGDITFTVPEASRAANLYYETVFDCKQSSAGKNGFVQLSKVVYVAE